MEKKKIKLRQAVTQFAAWTGAVVAAGERQFLLPFEVDEKLLQLQIEMRKWLGEELLNKEIGVDGSESDS